MCNYLFYIRPIIRWNNRLVIADLLIYYRSKSLTTVTHYKYSCELNDLNSWQRIRFYWPLLSSSLPSRSPVKSKFESIFMKLDTFSEIKIDYKILFRYCYFQSVRMMNQLKRVLCNSSILFSRFKSLAIVVNYTYLELSIRFNINRYFRVTSINHLFYSFNILLLLFFFKKEERIRLLITPLHVFHNCRRLRVSTAFLSR